MNNNSKDYFNNNGYVILKNALTKEQCKELVDYMFYLYKEGRLEKDEQCPLSDSVYGSEVFEDYSYSNKLALLKNNEKTSKND